MELPVLARLLTGDRSYLRVSWTCLMASQETSSVSQINKASAELLRAP